MEAAATRPVPRFRSIASSDIYLWYDGPRLYSVLDAEGERYLACNVAEEDGYETFVYAPLEAERLAGVLEGSIELRDVFTRPAGGEVLLCFVPELGRPERASRWMRATDQPEEWLHRPGLKLFDNEGAS